MCRLPATTLLALLLTVGCGGDDTTEDTGCDNEGTWYLDHDQDGYGDPDFSLSGCSQPASYVENDEDCDDLSADNHPGADEVCDDVDNDCDTETDEDDALDASTWYADDDNDGYGSADETTAACDQPEGYVDNTEDCDDHEPLAWSGATETCADGVDNDCDETANECRPSGSLNAGTDAALGLYGAAEDDRAGRSVAVVDHDGDGQDDLFIGAPNSTDDLATPNRGVSYLVNGPLTGDVELGLEASAQFTGTAEGGHSGTAVGGADLNGDGSDDLFIGAPGLASETGRVYLTYGGGGGASGSISVDDADAFFEGFSTYESMGSGVANAGDLDNDGYEDLILAASNSDLGAYKGGALFLFYGSGTPYAGSYAIADADAEWMGVDTFDSLGTSVTSAGDMNGDGFDEFAFGVSGAELSGVSAGVALVILGSSTQHSGSGTTLSGDWTLHGETDEDHLGQNVSGAGDVDGDGYDDLLVGAGDFDVDVQDDVGRSYLVYGALDAGSFGVGATFTGADKNDYVGRGAASAGDLDADGYADVAIGGERDDDAASNAGAVFIFYGPATGSLEVELDADAKITGSSAGSGYFGSSFGGPGDVDGDGGADLVVGAYYNVTHQRDTEAW